MNKLEVYSLEHGLKHLVFLEKHPCEISGYHRLKNNTQFEPFRPGREDVIRVEVYLEEVPESLLLELAGVSEVIDTRVSGCTKVSLEALFEKTETDQQGSGSGLTVPLQDLPDFLMEVEEHSFGRFRVTIDSCARQFFLYKVFGVFAYNNIKLFRANTYPHDNRIKGIFVISRINRELLAQVREKLREVLANPESGNGGYARFERADIKDSEIKLSFQSGSLPAIKMTTENSDPLLRYTVQEAFVSFDLEMTVTRIGSRGKMIEDQYYLRSATGKVIDNDLVQQIKNHLITNKI